MPYIGLLNNVVIVSYTTEEVINLVEPTFAFEALIAPGNDYSMISRQRTLCVLEDTNLIHSLQHNIFRGVVTYCWSFKVPKEHLRIVERTLRHKHISYKKTSEPNKESN